jgi:two-component system copper resistance phosphate regulon response regulator CusR
MEILRFLNILFIFFRRFFMVNCYSLKRKTDTKRVRKRKLKTILIIEDETEIRNFIARVLELEGYNVFEAGDGTSGMEIIKDKPVSLVLLDLRLPGIDGWSILREIKRKPELSTIPVIVLTAIAETMQRKRTLRMGATSYLIKPLSAHSLSRAVASVLHEKSSQYQAAQEEVESLLKPDTPSATMK